MSHVASIVTARSAHHDAVRAAPAGVARAGGEDPDPPFWSPSRIDLARRLWSKGVDEEDILTAINKLPGATTLNAAAITALARRLRWPGPKSPPQTLVLVTRDGTPSIAERQAAELARTLEYVELPMEDAIAWGRANGVTRSTGEAEAAVLLRINRARATWRLPRFRATRRG